MAEDYGDRLDRHEAQLAELRLANARLVSMQIDLSGAVGRMERHMEIIEERLGRLDTRLERIEGLLERMLPGSSNGREV